MKRSNILNVKMFLVLTMIMVLTLGCSPKSLAAKPIRLIVDGEDITSLAEPITENGRTLVPVRFIAEAVGAKVDWDESNKKVILKKDDISVALKIDSHLIEYDDGKKTYGLGDVVPKIVGERTYIPARLVSNALGIGIEWNEDTRTVDVDSSKKSKRVPFFDMEITSIDSGQDISGKTNLKVNLGSMGGVNGVEIKYLLLDPDTAKGVVVARGKNLNSDYTWLPNIEDKGQKVLVAAIYDNGGKFLAGDAVAVNVNVEPRAMLNGIEENEVIRDTVILRPDNNFVASYVKYEITNLDKNTTNTSTEQDPQGEYKWTPIVGQNGRYAIKMISYDSNGKTYPSEKIVVNVEVPRKLSLGGVSAGQTIDKPVSLLANRNFDVSETQYILRDPDTKVETIIATIPYGSHKWFPGLEYKGEKEILVRVKDPKGQSYDSDAIKVKLAGTPKLLIQGIGPKQVITEEVKLNRISNIKLDSISYIAVNTKTGAKKTIASGVDPASEQKVNPKNLGDGNWNIKAIGKYNGKEVESEEVPVKIYLGKLHGPMPIIKKDKFLGFASGLARESWKETGMSAALQTAQAILETGWGQSVPVDKYSGKLSNNLFGIKQKGNEAYVISNTWEEYNGVKFRIDANFRAYGDPKESWKDHKRLLLEASRYEIFRDVMHDSTQGAWAIRRAGYATDSQYPIKLMDIIKRYNLQELDKISI